ncbi:ABC transporter ATP-binding protein [Thermopirellula anaerolimosa]
MSDIAIRAENLSKKFFLGERIGFKTFRETLQDAVVSPIRRIISGKANGATVEEKVDTDRQIWALKDVTFEVKHGEVLGIIGPNGAGKSTLLKILSRITEPTGGYAEIRGRVGSLLEVGTGFHPELTGRENVYLNGAILGMSRAEIRRKFDDIVSFAGVEKFIDTPVKRYSSGMQVRLAFAVAAHLDPEILIIDEVLAVGDAEFQKRCLGKMNEVSRSGRTVLFVSHNMAAVEALCQRGILLRGGCVAFDGSTDLAVQNHLDSSYPSQGEFDLSHAHRPSHLKPVIKKLRFVDANDRSTAVHRFGNDLHIELELEPTETINHAHFSLRILTLLGQRVVTWTTLYSSPRGLEIKPGSVLRLTLEQLRLAPGHYRLSVYLSSQGRSLDQVTNVPLEVADSPEMGHLHRVNYEKALYIPKSRWELAQFSLKG